MWMGKIFSFRPSLTTLKYVYVNHRNQSFFFNLGSSQMASQLFLFHLNTYRCCGSTAIRNRPSLILAVRGPSSYVRI